MGQPLGIVYKMVVCIEGNGEDKVIVVVMVQGPLPRCGGLVLWRTELDSWLVVDVGSDVCFPFGILVESSDEVVVVVVVVVVTVVGLVVGLIIVTVSIPVAVVSVMVTVLVLDGTLSVLVLVLVLTLVMVLSLFLIFLIFNFGGSDIFETTVPPISTSISEQTGSVVPSEEEHIAFTSKVRSTV